MDLVQNEFQLVEKHKNNKPDQVKLKSKYDAIRRENLMNIIH